MRLLSITFIFFFLVQYTSSQTHHFYGGYGYNYPTSSSSIGVETSSSTEYKNITGSFAEGYNIQLGYSIFLTDNIGFDIVYNYLIGSRSKRLSFSIISYSEYDNHASNITPSLILKTTVGAFSPYIKFGVSINFIALNIRELQIPPTSDIIEMKYENDYTIGVSSSIGVNYRFKRTFYLFADLHLNSLTFYPTKVSNYQYGILESSGPMKINIGFPFSSLGLSFGVKLEL